MEKLVYFLRTHPLQLIFSLIMVFILIGIISGFVYISEEQKQITVTPTIAPTQTPVPTEEEKEILNPTAETSAVPEPTIEIIGVPGVPTPGFTQEELSYPALAPESGSDYSHAGGLVVTSNPSEATVEISMLDVEEAPPASYSTPFRTTGLMVGRYTVTATKPGFQSTSITTTIAEGQVSRVNLTLRPNN